MNEVYKRLQNKLEALISEAHNILDTESPKSFEDKQAYRLVQNLMDELDGVNDRIKYIALPAIEGKLRENDSGKFELFDKTGKYVTYFSCGSRIEICDPDDGTWYLGRVEHKCEDGRRGYYFCGSCFGAPFLYNGMRARIRREY
jgi:hypothetical protein